MQHQVTLVLPVYLVITDPQQTQHDADSSTTPLYCTHTCTTRLASLSVKFPGLQEARQGYISRGRTYCTHNGLKCDLQGRLVVVETSSSSHKQHGLINRLEEWAVIPVAS